MFNFDKRPKNLFFCVGLINPFSPTQRHRWVAIGHPSRSTPQLQSERDRWVGHHSHPSLLHVNCPVGLIPQLKWTPPLSWILHPLPWKGNGTVELDNTLKCTAFPKSTPPLGWISHPFPPKGNVGFALLSQPLPSSPYMAAWCSDLEMHASPHTSFLDARALFLKQYTKQTINTIFTIFPTTTK